MLYTLYSMSQNKVPVLEQDPHRICTGSTLRHSIILKMVQENDRPGFYEVQTSYYNVSMGRGRLALPRNAPSVVV